MTPTPEFMLIFRLEPTNEPPTPEQLQDMHKHWGEFIGNIAMQGKLVSTHQLGFNGKQIFADHSVTDSIYVAEKQTIGGNLILKADSLETATDLAKKCPILFMGGSIEVREILPM
jgi:hypothetical protein